MKRTTGKILMTIAALIYGFIPPIPDSGNGVKMEHGAGFRFVSIITTPII